MLDSRSMWSDFAEAVAVVMAVAAGAYGAVQLIL